MKGEDSEANMGLILGVALGVGVPFLLIVGGAAFYFGKKSGYKQMQDERGGPTHPGTSPPAVVGNPA